MCVPAAHAHPVAQGSVELQIQPEVVTAIFRVSNEQVFVAESIGPNARPASSLEELWERHAEYVRDHVVVLADGVAVPGKLVTTALPKDRSVKGFVEYKLEYPQESWSGSKSVRTSCRKLNTRPATRGKRHFACVFSTAEGCCVKPPILAPKQPLVIELGSVASAFEGAATPRLTPLAWDYFIYGLRHITGGWDHILFVVALVIAVPRLWPVLALVTAFTIAHTITLTLAVLKLVSAPSSIVEPIIAVSIVVAAALNLVRTTHPPMLPRLIVAFGFGLFHDLVLPVA
jgi:hypothetical protein